MTYNTVGKYVMGVKGINNIELIDSLGNSIGNSYDSGITAYMDKSIKSVMIQDRGNFGIVATLVI